MKSTASFTLRQMGAASYGCTRRCQSLRRRPSGEATPSFVVDAGAAASKGIAHVWTGCSGMEPTCWPASSISCTQREGVAGRRKGTGRGETERGVGGSGKEVAEPRHLCMRTATGPVMLQLASQPQHGLQGCHRGRERTH